MNQSPRFVLMVDEDNSYVLPYPMEEAVKEFGREPNIGEFHPDGSGYIVRAILTNRSLATLMFIANNMCDGNLDGVISLLSATYEAGVRSQEDAKSATPG